MSPNSWLFHCRTLLWTFPFPSQLPKHSNWQSVSTSQQFRTRLWNPIKQHANLTTTPQSQWLHNAFSAPHYLPTMRRLPDLTLTWFVNLSVLKSHFKVARIGLFKQLYRLCERRFVRTHWLQEVLGLLEVLWVRTVLFVGKCEFRFRKFKKGSRALATTSVSRGLLNLEEFRTQPKFV